MNKNILLFAIAISCSPLMKAQKPNIIVILSDDMGYSDLGCFGSEITTPNLDHLAENGLKFTRFYNGARCCPTRASLLTGLYAHQSGVGYMSQNWGTPQYLGHLHNNCVTMGEVVQGAGYRTFHSGKWHVGTRNNGMTAENRGFDRSWTREARVDYFDHAPGNLKLDGQTWSTDDPEYYLTDYTAKFACEFIEEAVNLHKPFFGYVAFNAAHWPLHAKSEDVEKFKGKYAEGWDTIRSRRLQKQKEIGLINPLWDLSWRDESVPQWNEVTRKDWWQEKMEAYAAQVYSLDENIGRIVSKLEELGVAENTLIFFLQDNGGCAEGIGWNDKNTPGTPESYIAYHLPWANVSNTPFRMYKHFVNEGGISTPLIAFWPAQIPKGIITNKPAHLIDIMSTVVDVSGAEYPQSYKGEIITPMEGISLLPLLKEEDWEGHEYLFWEHEGNRALLQNGKWKLVSRYEFDYEYFTNWKFPKLGRTSEWELYDMENDRTEMHDLAEQYRDKLNELIAVYDTWAQRVKIYNGSKYYTHNASDSLDYSKIRAYIPFDGNTNNVSQSKVIISPSTSMDATGRVTFTDGVFGQAGVFNLSPLVTNGLNFEASQDFTISGWINMAQLPSVLGENQRWIHQKDGQDPGRIQLEILKNGDNISTYSGGVTSSHLDKNGNPFPMTPDTWYHFASVQDTKSGKRNLYINGESVGMVEISGEVNNNEFVIGSAKHEERPTMIKSDGKMDDLLIIQQTLSKTAINKILNLGVMNLLSSVVEKNKQFYYNPFYSYGVLYVNDVKNGDAPKVKVYNTRGMKVFESKNNTTAYPLQLTQGIYIVELSTKNHLETHKLPFY